MIRTLSSELQLDNTRISNKTNRVPYMGTQSLLYQNKINKETVLRYNKSLNISMEEMFPIPTSVLIHQTNPQSIPSFSSYHSNDTIYNIKPNDPAKHNESTSNIYDVPPSERDVGEYIERFIPIQSSQSVRIRKKPADLNIKNSNISPKKGFSTFSSNPISSPTLIAANNYKENNKITSLLEANNSVVDSSTPMRPISYSNVTCWNDFIATFSKNGSKSISWTRFAIKQPILNYVQKNQRKRAIKAFKIIQKYMGDRRTRKSPSQLFALLQSNILSNEILNDEILIQICKQTINNPDSRSIYRGWELLSECLLQFAPSQRLFPYLDDFILMSLDNEQRKNPSNLNTCLVNLRKCENNLSWLDKTCKTEIKDSMESSTITNYNQKRKRSISESCHNGNNEMVIYSPQTLSGIMKQQSFSFPVEEIPIELVTLCNQIADDLRNYDSFLSLYRHCPNPKFVKEVLINLEKWFNYSCTKGPHLVERKNVPNMQSVALHVLIYWFESLSQPVISQQLAFLSNFSIKNLTKINKQVIRYMVHFSQVHIINTSKDTVRNIASFLCTLIFQLPKEKFYPMETPKDSVYLNIILHVFQNYNG